VRAYALHCRLLIAHADTILVYTGEPGQCLHLPASSTINGRPSKANESQHSLRLRTKNKKIGNERKKLKKLRLTWLEQEAQLSPRDRAMRRVS